MNATNRRVSDLVLDVRENKLEVRPYFQRRLVWTNKDKEFFIDTVINGFPFPEIFISTGELDTTSIKRKNWLVDGQQRVTTLVSYIEGSDDIRYITIPRFRDLPPEKQRAFLNYTVVVRDLGIVTDTQLRDIFKRINSTDYALKSMEVMNAMYSGAYSAFTETLSQHSFFAKHRVFSTATRKRMYDVAFCVILVTTILAGYYRRDEKNKEYLERYNDDFPAGDAVNAGLNRVFDFVENCRLPDRSRVWKLTDLFTVLVEIYSALVERGLNLDPARVGHDLNEFFAKVDNMYKATGAKTRVPVAGEQATIFAYLKAATKATNDKYARIERARIIAQLIENAAFDGEQGVAQPKRRSRKGATVRD